MASFVPSPPDIEQFQRDGYLILRVEQHGLVKPEDLQDWTEQVRKWPAEKGKWMPYHEVNTDGTRQLMRTENFVEYHQRFYDLLCGEAIAAILKALSGDVSISQTNRTMLTLE
jgi:2-aminoethylphosphonate dioxygenase